MLFLIKTIVLLTMLSAFTAPQKPGPGSIAVEITGIPSTKGLIRIALFDKAEGFTQHEFALQKASIPVKAATAAWTFQGLVAGRYAVAVYHDENSNAILDTNFLGIPTEAYGFSNDAMGTFGPPSFQAASFWVGTGATSIKIKLH